MRVNSSKRTVTIEEFSLPLDKQILAEIIESELGEEAVGVSPRDISLFIAVGAKEPATIGAVQILEIVRGINKDIPEDAEIVLTVRWKKEQEAKQQVAAGSSLPTTASIPAELALQCPTCGGLPLVHGPTPDCQDAAGCGKVRAEKGEMVIPRAVISDTGATGPGVQAVPPGIMVNRETGKRAFMAKDGTPYGVHDDYEK